MKGNYAGGVCLLASICFWASAAQHMLWLERKHMLARTHAPPPPSPGVHAEPYTMSVRKRASRMSLAAADFAMRSVGGKTHMR